MTAALQPASDVVHPRSQPSARNKLALIDAAWVCHHLPALADLNQADKAVLCALIRHIDQLALTAGRTTVWPSTVCLALDTGYTERSITRSISRLEARCLIRRFLPPRRRTYHTDLSGFCRLAANILDAHAAAKADRLPRARICRSALMIEPDAVSVSADTASGLTETAIKPEKPVEQSDAARGRFRRRPAEPAAAGCTFAIPPDDAEDGTAVNCSPGGAGFSTGAELGPSIPEERGRGALVAAWGASPTLRRLVDIDRLRTDPLEALNAIVARDYLATVSGIRNPHHIWNWAVNRHGAANAMLGWIIACDTPASPDRPVRNPAGWFTRFATSERPWDLSRNLHQLGRVAPAATPPAADRAGPALANPDQEIETMEHTLAPTAAEDLLAQYRSAWIAAAARRLGRSEAAALAVWKSWLDEAAASGVDDDRLQIRVKTKFVRDQVDKDYGDICRVAAEVLGYAGVDFVTAPR